MATSMSNDPLVRQRANRGNLVNIVDQIIPIQAAPKGGDQRMLETGLFYADRVPDNLLADLENRDVALWIASLPQELGDLAQLASFLGLPWALVLSETYDSGLFEALQSASSFDDPMTSKRGFVHVIETDPSKIELPQRCLPIYLLNGKSKSGPATDFESRLRRMTMLESLRRSGVRDVIVLSEQGDPLPSDLKDLWLSGFRARLYCVSNGEGVDAALANWVKGTGGTAIVTLVALGVQPAIEDIIARYAETYPQERQIIRVGGLGQVRKVDVTRAEEPERPISEWYSLIQERDLAPVMPEELSEQEFVEFFRDPTTSWRPYAAGLPWMRNQEARTTLSSLLKKLDSVGADENVIAYISAESGSGGTTLARTLAWEFARKGYPVLVAKEIPFVPDALPVVNYLGRVHNLIAETRKTPQSPKDYEVPWIIVFDSIHWQHRDSELVRFRNELEKGGRPVCLLVVTGPDLGLSFLNGSIFRKLTDLNHSIDLGEAQDLGAHLNRYLVFYGKTRELWQWERFYKEHTVRYLEGVAAFWVTLSFWIQRQYDLSESIQEWMYRIFKQNVEKPVLREAIFRIAALSAERIPLPDVLLPEVKGEWPTSELLNDVRSKLAALGLVRVRSEGEKYWALVHDILGRLLINALFYDFPLRDELGLGSAKDVEELRFMLLKRISQEPVLGERAQRSIGEDFATTIFKIDPDHGRSSYVAMWRDVLKTLDGMPGSLKDTSRVFRHHTAISRRRIAKLDENFYGVSTLDKIVLLEQAIKDITYALNMIAYTPGSEPNINLLNSLANAYFDLAEAEGEAGASAERISNLRRLANDATRRAYEENPTSSFVIETYVKNLIYDAKFTSSHATEKCVEALGILFSALMSNEVVYRSSQLGNLADQALRILMRQPAAAVAQKEPANAIDVLVQAWRALAQNDASWTDFSDVPESNLQEALAILAHPAGRGNTQVIRLNYDLTCISRPTAFKDQLTFAEQLEGGNNRVTPQLKLEYAILLFQNSRAMEGEKIFRYLRKVWREGEHYVQVPDRLRWLLGPDGKKLQTVHATTASDFGSRAFARVQEFGGIPVPFRPEEHGVHSSHVGMRFTCHVSFGHNGPFLRPVTAGPHG
jgi:hypothetical protein